MSGRFPKVMSGIIGTPMGQSRGHPGKQVSVGVTNLQYVLSLGALDTRYITPEARLAISAQTIIEKAAGSTGVYLNLGNINWANQDDFDTQGGTVYMGADGLDGTADAIQNELYTSAGFLKSIMFVSVGQFTTAIQRLADVRAETGFIIARIMQTGELTLFASGRYVDRIDLTGPTPKFIEKTVVLDSPVIDTLLALPF